MSNYKKQKYYSFTLTQINFELGSDLTMAEPTYVREDVQSSESYQTIEDAITAFLKQENYSKDFDSEIMFFKVPIVDSKKDATSIQFSRVLNVNGQRPSKDEYDALQRSECKLIQTNISVIVYQFEVKLLDLKDIKKNIEKVLCNV